MSRKNRRASKFYESLIQNDAIFAMQFDRLTEIAISRFEYKNLPESVDERFLELTLYENGQVVWFKDEELGEVLALPVAAAGKLDMYRVPRKRTAYSTGYTFKNLTEENSVIMYNNYLRKPTKLNVMCFAYQLYELDRSIEVNAKAQRTPILICCDENERLTLENMYQQYNGNQPVIYGTKELRADAFKVLKTDAPYHGAELYDLKTKYWNECLTFLGISNTNITKKERLISDEVIRDMGGTIASRFSPLFMRRQALEKINKMFGLNIEVNFRADYREMDDEIMLTGATEDNRLQPVVTDLRTNFKGGDLIE